MVGWAVEGMGVGPKMVPQKYTIISSSIIQRRVLLNLQNNAAFELIQHAQLRSRLNLLTLETFCNGICKNNCSDQVCIWNLLETPQAENI